MLEDQLLRPSYSLVFSNTFLSSQAFWLYVFTLLLYLFPLRLQ